MFRTFLPLILALPVASLASASITEPQTFSFGRVTNNSSVNLGVGAGGLDQLHLTITTEQVPADGSYPAYQAVVFDFTNNVGTKSSITAVYFSDGHYLAPPMSFGGTGISFRTKDNQGEQDNPPGINNWHTTAYGEATLDDEEDLSPTAPGNPKNGVNTSVDHLIVTFKMINGDYTRLIHGLNQDINDPQKYPLFRIALHVKSIGNAGDSDTYLLQPNGAVDTDPEEEPTPVPEPATLAIWGLGLGIAGLVKLRRNVLLV